MAQVVMYNAFQFSISGDGVGVGLWQQSLTDVRCVRRSSAAPRQHAW
jgi:hypothetical protein